MVVSSPPILIAVVLPLTTMLMHAFAFTLPWQPCSLIGDHHVGRYGWFAMATGPGCWGAGVNFLYAETVEKLDCTCAAWGKPGLGQGCHKGRGGGTG